MAIMLSLIESWLRLNGIAFLFGNSVCLAAWQLTLLVVMSLLYDAVTYIGPCFLGPPNGVPSFLVSTLGHQNCVCLKIYKRREG